MQLLKKYFWLLLSLLVAILAARMLLTSSHFHVHDDIQVFRVSEYLKCFTDKQFPCRWSAELGKGYGYPLFNYYPPMIYAIPSLIHLTGLSIITSLNLFMFSTFLLAAFGMYALARTLTGRDELGFLGSVLYTLYPFHAVNVFIRGVYAENFVWSLAPLILYIISQSVKYRRFSRTLPLLFSLVFLTHVLSSFVIIGIVIFWSLLSAYYYSRPLLSSLSRTLISLLIGIGVASFFIIPAIFEKNIVQSESLISGYYSYFNHFVSLAQLFIRDVWNYGASLWGTPVDEMPFMIGRIHLILLAILITFAVVFSLKKSNPKNNHKTLVTALILLALFSTFIFLTHFKSEFIWKYISSFQYFQFPWRFIAWAGIPLVMAIIFLSSLLPKKFSPFIALSLAIILSVYSYPFFKPQNYDQISDADLISGKLRSQQQVSNLYDYLPKGVKEMPASYASSPLFTKYNGVEVFGSQRTSKVFTIELSSESAQTITLSQFYFPGWEGVINHKKVDLAADPANGLTQVFVQAGASSISLSFKETAFRRLADLSSLFFLAVYIVYFFWTSSKKGTFKLQ